MKRVIVDDLDMRYRRISLMRDVESHIQSGCPCKFSSQGSGRVHPWGTRVQEYKGTWIQRYKSPAFSQGSASELRVRRHSAVGPKVKPGEENPDDGINNTVLNPLTTSSKVPANTSPWQRLGQQPVV